MWQRLRRLLDEYNRSGKGKIEIEAVLPTRGGNWQAFVVATELLMAIHAVLPRGMRVYPDWGLHTPLGDFEPDLMVAPDELPDESYAAVPPLLDLANSAATGSSTSAVR